jgi:Proton-conducting membrane transporter
MMRVFKNVLGYCEYGEEKENLKDSLTESQRILKRKQRQVGTDVKKRIVHNLFKQFGCPCLSKFVQMFLGWEGVGLCSYLLINFWSVMEGSG